MRLAEPFLVDESGRSDIWCANSKSVSGGRGREKDSLHSLNLKTDLLIFDTGGQIDFTRV